MSQKINNSGTLLEPSVGSGNLLKYLDLSKYSSIDLYELKKEYLDITIDSNNISKINDDFLRVPIIKKYDNIIMNPPYIKVQDLSTEYRAFLKSNFNYLVIMVEW
jgi:tRNA1(Val) A37 N6-methylase TrmN6